MPFDFRSAIVEAEPRLVIGPGAHRERAAGGVPRQFVADIPYTLSLFHRFFGDLHVIGEITGRHRPTTSACPSKARRFTGHASLDLRDLDAGSEVRIDGAVLPRSASARLVLRPFVPIVERLATRAILRGVLRAASFVTA